MSALRATLLDWDPSRVTRVLSAASAVFVAARTTDAFFPGLILTLLLAVVFDGVFTSVWRLVPTAGGER